MKQLFFVHPSHSLSQSKLHENLNAEDIIRTPKFAFTHRIQILSILNRTDFRARGSKSLRRPHVGFPAAPGARIRINLCKLHS